MSSIFKLLMLPLPINSAHSHIPSPVVWLSTSDDCVLQQTVVRPDVSTQTEAQGSPPSLVMQSNGVLAQSLGETFTAATCAGYQA